jgi:hypothetical protein
MAQRNDEVGELIDFLKHVVATMEDDDPVFLDADENSPPPRVSLSPLPKPLLLKIITALERVPRRRGNPGAISGKAAWDEFSARWWAKYRKYELIDEGLSATEAEWQAAEEAVSVFLTQAHRPQGLRRHHPAHHARPAHKDISGREEIRVVDLARGIERLATPEEIENGVYYRDYDHFKEGKAA